VSIILIGHTFHSRTGKFRFADQQITFKMAAKAKRGEKKREKKDIEEQIGEVEKEEAEELAESEEELVAEDDEDEDEDENGEEENDEEEDREEEEEGIPLSDIESDAETGQDVDIVPYQKLYKDNHAALTQALSTIALPISSLPFHVHQSVTSTESVPIDVNDDLQRELAFYKQALEAAKEGRKKLLAEGVPFSRPPDYFAEMIKDDEHMEKVHSQ
jgi:rRNA-processing protein EBP2